MNKNNLRKILKQKREDINNAKRKNYSKLIFKNFLFFFEKFLKNIRNILIYNSFQSEVDTKKFIKFFWEKNINVYIPAIINDKIIAVKFSPDDKLNKGKYGILEPVKKIKIKNIKSLNIVFVPGIGFDINGNRIGFGKGYFDRFLKNLDEKTIKIGLAFSKQIVKKIPATKQDIKMNYIITEKGVMDCTVKK